MKFAKVLRVGVACLSLLGMAACNKGGGAELAVVTDVGSINDHSFNEACYKGMVDYAESAKKSYAYYQPTENSTANRVATIETAISKGAKTVVLPGYLFNSSIKQVQDKHPNVNFLAIDCDPSDDDNGYTPYNFSKNVTSLKYQEEQSGFFAGYAAVAEGYTKIGFLGGMAVPAVVKYGQGYLYGANKAAEDLGLNGKVDVNYWYCGGFAPTDAIATKMQGWYESGTQVIFSCGGGIYSSCLTAAAKSSNKKVIGVDVDQSSESELIITSAMKNMRVTVKDYLTKLYASQTGSWPADYAGKSLTLGASQNAVGLPTEKYNLNGKEVDPWRMTNFTKTTYNSLYTQVQNGTISVPVITSEDAHVTSFTKLTVNYQK
ncbi:MAG: BMP family ABC transporter substrate-binding protein [Bacilli bacterium]|nr:BMP family ABC transporter substrate-binding protein [Bacilli bacterium]